MGRWRFRLTGIYVLNKHPTIFSKRLWLNFGTLIFTENIDFKDIFYLRPGDFQPSKELNINIRVRQF